MRIKCRSGVVTLKPFEKEEIADKHVVDMLSDYEVTKYLSMRNSPTIVDEEEWWEKARKDEKNLVWGIYLDDSSLIGNTSLRITSQNHTGFTGFMIYEKKHWRKGIASACHVARTYYAAHILNLKTIVSAVFTPNIGSYKALCSVGYFPTGHNLAAEFINGSFKHLIYLQWIHPEYKELILEDGIPDDLAEKINPAIELAKKTLQKGEKEVMF